MSLPEWFGREVKQRWHGLHPEGYNAPPPREKCIERVPKEFLHVSVAIEDDNRCRFPRKGAARDSQHQLNKHPECAAQERSTWQVLEPWGPH